MGTVKCPLCKREAFHAVVAKYIWTTEGKFDIMDGYVTIENANVYRCEKCGEGPIDDAEDKRWKMIAYREEIRERGDEEDQCEVCGVPQSMTGQFFSVMNMGSGETRHYCNSCYEQVEFD